MSNELDGGKSCDDRGYTTYFNNFNPTELGIKRLYIVENFDTEVVRAWHAHWYENKWVTCISGAAIIGIAEIYGNITHGHDPRGMSCTKYVLTAESPKFIFLPAGQANGAKALTNDTKLLYFSDKTLEESIGDDYRISYDFSPQFWKRENR